MIYKKKKIKHKRLIFVNKLTTLSVRLNNNNHKIILYSVPTCYNNSNVVNIIIYNSLCRKNVIAALSHLLHLFKCKFIFRFKRVFNFFPTKSKALTSLLDDKRA